jgi:hypothetical protein
VRFRALVAAILRIVRRRDRKRTKISSFLTGARKKVWKAFPGLWDRSEADDPRILVDMVAVSPTSWNRRDTDSDAEGGIGGSSLNSVWL